MNFLELCGVAGLVMLVILFVTWISSVDTPYPNLHHPMQLGVDVIP
jgi:hypothetical protein